MITGAGVLGVAAQADAAPGGHDGNDDSASFDGGDLVDANDARSVDDDDDSKPSETFASSSYVFEDPDAEQETDNASRSTFERESQNEATPDINGDGMVSMDEAIATTQSTSNPDSDLDAETIELDYVAEPAIGLSETDVPDVVDQSLTDFGGPGPTIGQNDTAPRTSDPDADADAERFGWELSAEEAIALDVPVANNFAIDLPTGAELGQVFASDISSDAQNPQGSDQNPVNAPTFPLVEAELAPSSNSATDIDGSTDDGEVVAVSPDFETQWLNEATPDDFDLPNIDPPNIDPPNIDLSEAGQETPEPDNVLGAVDQSLIDFGGPGPTIAQNIQAPTNAVTNDDIEPDDERFGWELTTEEALSLDTPDATDFTIDPPTELALPNESPTDAEPPTDGDAVLANSPDFESQSENEASPDINGDGMVSMDEAIATFRPTSNLSQTDQPTPEPDYVLGAVDQSLIDFGGPGPTIAQNTPIPTNPGTNTTFQLLTSQIDNLLGRQPAKPTDLPTAQQGPPVNGSANQGQTESTPEAPLPGGAIEIPAAGDQTNESTDQAEAAPSQGDVDSDPSQVEPPSTTPEPVLDKYGAAISERALAAAEIQNIRLDQIHVYQPGRPGWDEAMQAVDLLRDLGRSLDADGLEADLQAGRVSAYQGRITDPSFALKDNLIVNINSERPEQIGKIVHEALHTRQYMSPEPNPEIKAHALETVARLSLDIDKDEAVRLTQVRASTIQSFYPHLASYSVDEVADWLASEMLEVLPEETPEEWKQVKQDLEAFLPDLSLDENAKRALMEMGGTGLDPVAAPDGEMRSGDVTLSNGPNGTFTISEYIHERNARIENTVHRNTGRRVAQTVYNYDDNSVDTWDYTRATKTTIYQDSTSVTTEFRPDGLAQRVTIDPDGGEDIEVFAYTDDDLR